MTGVMIVAHRGASEVCPENTLTAFRRAIEFGADGIEFNVQATGNGRLIVIHDLSLERTTNGHGPVFAAEFDKVRALDAGGRKGHHRTTLVGPDNTAEQVFLESTQV